MRFLKTVLALSALVGTAACGAEPKREPAADLSWLDTIQFQNAPVQPAGVVSPLEAGMAATAAPVAAAPVQAVAEEVKETRAAAPARSSSRRSSARRSSSSSSGTYASAPARQPRVTTVRHTKRDAAIGAVAGGVIGAVAGGRRHRVKGAVIGAVAGGVAGAIIGNKVDTEHRVEY